GVGGGVGARLSMIVPGGPAVGQDSNPVGKRQDRNPVPRYGGGLTATGCLLVRACCTRACSSFTAAGTRRSANWSRSNSEPPVAGHWVSHSASGVEMYCFISPCC